MFGGFYLILMPCEDLHLRVCGCICIDVTNGPNISNSRSYLYVYARAHRPHALVGIQTSPMACAGSECASEINSPYHTLSNTMVAASSLKLRLTVVTSTRTCRSPLRCKRSRIYHHMTGHVYIMHTTKINSIYAHQCVIESIVSNDCECSIDVCLF